MCIETRTEGLKDGRTDGRKYGREDAEMDARKSGCTDGRTHGKMDGYTEEQTTHGRNDRNDRLIGQRTDNSMDRPTYRSAD